MGVLTGQTPASDYGGLLNINAGNQIGLTNVLQQVTDGFGNPTPLQLSTIALNIIRSGYTFQLDGVAVTALSVDINSMCQPNPIALGTGALKLPAGSTADRPLAPLLGMERYNTDSGAFEGYTGTGWQDFPSGSFVTSILGTADRITVSGTSTVTIDIAATYAGQTSITTIGSISTGVWTSTATPINTTSGGTNIVSYTLGDILYSSAANTLAKLAGNTTSGIQYLSQTGTGVVSAAPVWATISGGDITGAALTKVDDTNVTMVLGGTPATALLRSASMTLGWTGTLAYSRGGLGAAITADNGGIFYSTASNAALLASVATAGKMLQSGASAAPSWSTPTYPSASGTAGQIIRSDGTNNLYSTATFADTYAASSLLYSNGANAVTGLATANSAVVVTNSTGVPVLSGTMTDGQLIIGSTGATPVAASLTAGSGVTITPGAGSLTISATGSGGTVTSVSGTLDRITSTGGTTPVIDIAATYVGQTSLTTLGTITTGTWSATNIDLNKGGTNAALTASNGGLVYSTASALAILSGTATANQIPLSGSNAAPSWSTATYPATTTINQLLYSNAANTITGLATANSAVLVTTSAGVPALSGTMTNGQLIIGSTGATPTAATLTAGSNITITNAAGAITIAATGGGSGTVTSVATAGLATGGTITTTGTITVTAAVKSDQTTGSSTSVAVVPGVQQYHNSACQSWVFTQTNGTILASYNVSSVTKDSAGRVHTTLTTSYSTANYQISCSTQWNQGGGCVVDNSVGTPQAAGVFYTLNLTIANVVTDPNEYYFATHGVQ